MNEKISGILRDYDAYGFPANLAEKQSFGLSVCIYSTVYPTEDLKQLKRNYFHIEIIENESKIASHKLHNGFKAKDIFVISADNQLKAKEIVEDIKANHGI